jgi:hypothetical protein
LRIGEAPVPTEVGVIECSVGFFRWWLVQRNFIGFYWILPVPSVGFTCLPKGLFRVGFSLNSCLG